MTDVVSTSAARAFWAVAIAFGVVMSFMTVPTPLYAAYERRDGFGTFTVTLVFAAYGLGVLVGLLLLGHVSDHVGRRPVMVGAVALEVGCAVAFALLPQLAPLLVLRFATGVGVGAASSTVTAWLGELHGRWRPRADPRLGSTVATVVNVGGLAVGPLAAALLADLPGSQLSTPYWVYAAVLVVPLLVMALAPETVPAERRAEHWSYRPQKVAVADDVRPAFVGAAVAALAGFAVLGFVTALTGRFLADTLAITSRTEIGVVATVLVAGSAVSQILLATASRRRQLQVGAVLVAVGMLGVGSAALAASLAVFVVGGVLAGGGVGLVFAASVATVSGLASDDARGATLAALFSAAYVGITVPVVLIGVALSFAGTAPVLVAFAAVVFVAVPAGIGVLLRRTE